MIVLALDTSTSMCCVGLVSDDAILAEKLLLTEFDHSVWLVKMIDSILRDSSINLGDVDAYGVGLGPGSFTGLRVGLATIKGLALSNPKPLAGIPTLDALAAAAPQPGLQVCPLIDGKRGQVFTALYVQDGRGSMERKTDFLSVEPPKIAEITGNRDTLFIGDGLRTYGPSVKKLLEDRALFSPPELWAPRASIIGRLAIERIKKKDTDRVEEIVPIYVRSPDIRFPIPPG